MTRFFARFFFVLFALASSLLQARPCGGDGPIPFLNLTNAISLPVKAIQSVGAIKEFSFWESQDALVYRNSSNELRVSYFGSTTDTLLTKQPYPLSKLTDPSERYLLTDQVSYFFDASTNGPWVQYTKAEDAEKLFWKGNSLYLIKWVDNLILSDYYEIGKYVAGDKKATSVCTFKPPSHSELYLAQGHTYPDVFLYQPVKIGTKTSLAFYRMNVNTCKVLPIGLPTEPIEGKIKEVHRFEKLDAFAVEIDHPTKNFRWESASRCEYLKISKQTPLIPSHDRPLVVTFNPANGLTFYNLETMKKAEAFRGIGIKDVTVRDLWIPRHESDLLMSPEIQQTLERRMLSVDVEEILPVATH